MKATLALAVLAFAVIVAADVSELGGGPSNQYLAPFGNGNGNGHGNGLGNGHGNGHGAGRGGNGPEREYLPPNQQGGQHGGPGGEPSPAHTFGDDGYQYKSPSRF